MSNPMQPLVPNLELFRLPGLSIRPVLDAHNIFQVDPPGGALDDLVTTALTPFRVPQKEEKREAEFLPFREAIAAIEEKVRSEGLSASVAEVTSRLNRQGLDRTVRLLLSTPGVYHKLLLQALVDDKVDPRDTLGVASSVLRNAHSGPKRLFHRELFRAVILRRRLDINQTHTLFTRVLKAMGTMEVPLGPGQPEATISMLVEELGRDGGLTELVENFANRGEIDPVRFTPAVKGAMIEFLREIGLQVLPSTSATNQRYDEYLALAFNHAIRNADGAATDPLDAARRKGSTIGWNFEVDTFDYVEEQGVVPQNILAAGALDYIYVLGETMGIFRLADAVVLRWANGSVDVADGPTASKLYRYWKLRAERTTPEERAMLYRRVLARGDGRLLSGMVANEDFPALWGALMTEVAKYIEKSEKRDRDTSFVSKTPVYQVTKQLQYNLTEHATGMTHLQVTEMYSHLREAMEIFSTPEVVAHYATGTRKNMWSAIERASRQEFGAVPNLSALRTLAVDGNRVFRWLAEFDQGTVREEQFRQLLESAEAWILAQAAGGPEPSDAADEEDWAEEPADDDSDWDN